MGNYSTWKGVSAPSFGSQGSEASCSTWGSLWAPVCVESVHSWLVLYSKVLTGFVFTPIIRGLFLITGLASWLDYCHFSRWELPAVTGSSGGPCGFLHIATMALIKIPWSTSIPPWLDQQEKDLVRFSLACHSWIVSSWRYFWGILTICTSIA